MNCPHCDTANPAEARFCFHCGQRLALTCSQCGTALPAGARFCFHCGQPTDARTAGPDIPGASGAAAPAPPAARRAPPAQPQTSADTPPASPAARFLPRELAAKLEDARHSRTMEGERRIVTMLFCDVIGSTAAALQLDPEDWTEIINGAFEQMITPVYRYEGTVARLMGDAILAFFGAPLAHEDDPQRAVLAGLDIITAIAGYREQIRSRWQIEFDVRVGINTGLVVVGAVGSDLRMEYTAIGDAINLAARMEQTAAPGTVQIAHDTYRLVAPLFEVVELGPLTVKGRQEPVPAYRVLGRRAEPGRLRGIAGHEAPLIGRDEEWRQLQAIRGLVQRGSGRIVFLLGEAGLGKSRLIQELKTAWPEAPPEPGSLSGVIWHETASLSYEATQPYALIQRLLRQAVGATQTDPAGSLQRRLVVLVETLAAAGQPDDLMLLETLFNLAPGGDGPRLEGETFKNQFQAFLSRLARHWARQAALVLVFDDLHWADSTSVAMVRHLLPLVEELPLLLVIAMRPDREAPGWQLRLGADADLAHRVTSLTLRPLTQQDSSQLMDRLLSVGDLPAGLSRRILARAEGNPFFLEEVVRNLLDSGAIRQTETGRRWVATGDEAELDIPDNLQALLMARIDRLEEDARRTLQLAAVIGRNFYFRVLQLVSDLETELEEHLRLLQRVELIHEAARVPELEYIFRHALVQETAYRSILKQRRREFHRRVGETLETLFPDRLEEYAPVLAYHFAEADQDEKALIYHGMAGEAAYRLYANAEAVDHFSRALEIACRGLATEADIRDLYLKRGRALELSDRYDEAYANYQELAVLARSRQSKPLELAALMAQATIHVAPSPLYDPEQGEALSLLALELAQALKDHAAAAKIHWNLLLRHMYAGNADQAAEHGEQSVQLARRHAGREQLAFSLHDLGVAYMMDNRLERARPLIIESREQWRELGNMPMLVDNLGNSAYLHWLAGEFDQALARSDEGFVLGEQIGNRWGKISSQSFVSLVHYDRGEIDAAYDRLDRAITLADEVSHPVRMIARIQRAMLYELLGDYEAGLIALDQAMAHQPFPLFTPWALATRGLIWLSRGDLAQAVAYIDEARPAIGRRGHMVVPVQVALAAAEMALARGEAASIAVTLAPLAQQLAQQGVRASLPDVHLALARAQLAQGAPAEAAHALEQALGTARALGARRTLWLILAFQALVYDRRGDDEAAESARTAAGRVLAEIAGQIDRPERRDAFLATARLRWRRYAGDDDQPAAWIPSDEVAARPTGIGRASPGP